MNILLIVSLFILLAGFIIGLGAVTVIDWHGFLARKSSYWTSATIRSHKVTKVLIWFGIFLVVVGGNWFYYLRDAYNFSMYQNIFNMILIFNGLFLSYVISPYLLKREKDGLEHDLLPIKIQIKISVSFIVSFIFWWGSVLLLVIFLTN